MKDKSSTGEHHMQVSYKLWDWECEAEGWMNAWDLFTSSSVIIVQDL